LEVGRDRGSRRRRARRRRAGRSQRSEVVMNPYQPPATPTPPRRGPMSEFDQEACPSCRSTDINKPGFTWWGGALGPRMLNHRVCRACGFGYNAKTGQSNTTAITIYVVVAFVLSGILFYYLRF
jgi:hypothetical protein